MAALPDWRTPLTMDYRTLHKQKALLEELVGKRLRLGCQRKERSKEYTSCNSLIIEPDSGVPLLLKMAPDKMQPYYERMKLSPLPPSKHTGSKLEFLDLRTSGPVKEISLHQWEQFIMPETYILDGFISIRLKDETQIHILRGEKEHNGDIIITSNVRISELLGYSSSPQLIIHMPQEG